ncbi:MAG: hypothetical protein JWQ74_107 [Marmoricola sp.]|nr:hypothetical protein [Marmoricola sp.]
MTTKHRFRRTTLAVGLAGVLVAATACGSSGGGRDEGGTIKLGVPLALTGPAAATADWARMGVELSVKQINAAGGIDGRKVKAVYADTELDPTNAVTVVNRLINQDKVDLMVGPITSDETLATLPMTTKANIASINGSGSEITPEVAPYSFAMLMNAEFQADKMVDYAVEKYGAKSIGTVAYSATQGKTADRSFKAAAKKRNLPITSKQFDVPVTDLTPQLLDLKASNPDVLLSFNQTGDDTGRLVLALRELKWDVPVVASYGSTFSDQAKGVAGDNAFDGLKSVTWGAFSACSEADVRQESADFIAAVEAEFDDKRVATAALDYVAVYRDALFLLKAGVEGSGSTDGDKVAKWLETEGADAAMDLSLVHEGYAMSKDNHFLMDTDSLTLIDAGEELAPGINRRLDCN